MSNWKEEIAELQAKMDSLNERMDRIIAFTEKLSAAAEEMAKNPLLKTFIGKVGK